MKACLWRGGLPPFGCEAVVKPSPAVYLTPRSRRFWGRCATQRGQATSPQVKGAKRRNSQKTPGRCPQDSPGDNRPPAQSGTVTQGCESARTTLQTLPASPPLYSAGPIQKYRTPGTAPAPRHQSLSPPPTPPQVARGNPPR